MIASVATYPHEVLRTRLQIQKYARDMRSPAILSQTYHAAANSSHTSQLPRRTNFVPTTPVAAAAVEPPGMKIPYQGIAETFRKILREEGYQGFYRGMGVNLLRTVPSSAMTILTYVFPSLFMLLLAEADVVGI